VEHTRCAIRYLRVEIRTLRDPRPPAKRKVLVPRTEPLRKRLLAQLPLQVGERNLHRAYDTALVAERRRRGQILGVFEADVHRRQDGADRPGVDPAVGVPADVLVHGAMIHARAATDAAQRVAHVTCEHAGATAIDDDEVHVLGAVELAFALGPRQYVDVV